MQLEKYVGNYTFNNLFTPRTLDASDTAKFLKEVGCNIESFRDVGTHGEVITTCGYKISTNGYVLKT